MSSTASTLGTTDRERNASKSRETILDAAERLFAEEGFERTSLSDVGLAAGVSRGTPGYFFGSKAELYAAVLDRCYTEVREAVKIGRERALASQQSPDVILAGAVSDYYDFLSARPHFVRLIEREILSGGKALEGVPSQLAAGQEALAAMSAELGLDTADGSGAAHLLVSIISLCWFTVLHARTLLRTVGLDPDTPGFAEERKAAVIDLVLNGVRDRLPAVLKA